ncbi:DNA-binding transcriptional LysR family regulator [Roseiarcus fermentans]|uniref:DNA-binding transcriptional LysR family regulator n=1 Tax=Roseiarcus fermentans TaxID=1473586 RepID=A0A366EHY8_9HYPH|nr:LysR family transcriptional regulator [Roseiarcus fermentans]RBP02027.1 DNA-binding transcriptional LysR family regulator [Roseiarcus fermentans]
MEMHQIRYFLAAARTLNFTRAAEECGVSQPSLTRAIQTLEAELGGELLLRERGLTHLTDLGVKMLPLVQQCFDSASAARSLATSLKSGAVTPLKLALSSSINIAILLPQLSELSRSFAGMELKFFRAAAADLADHIKRGGADLGVAGPLKGEWERFDRWTLFTEPFVLAVSESHRYANRQRIMMRELQGERIIRRSHCEGVEDVEALLEQRGLTHLQRHEASSEADVVGLLSANVGVALVPSSADLPANLRRLRIADATLERSVSVYGVAGRPRSPIATMLLKMLRASDWSAYRA